MSRRFLKLYSLSLLLLLMAVAVVLNFSEQHLRKNLEDELKLNGNRLISQLNKQMELTFSNITSDLKLLASDEHLDQFHPSPQAPHNVIALQRFWTKFSEHRNHYDQIRFLDRKGKEVVRINYNRGRPTPVPKRELQSKRHRYYFRDVIDLPAGSVYVSPLDLNIENKQVELPLKPMMRFGTPVSNKQGKKIGVMLLNYLAEDLLSAFTLTSAGFQGQAMLFNHDGYPLISTDSSQTWNFMFPDSPHSTLRILHPSIWHALISEPRGQYLTSEGLFTFEHVDPSGGQHEALCKGCLTILLLTPQAQIESMLLRQTQAVLPAFLFSLLLIAIILGLLLWHWDRRRIQQRQIAALNDQIAFEHDLFVNGPGTIAKLRNEIGWPMDYISNNIQDLLGYTPDEFLRQGLTYASIIDPDYLAQYISETQAADQAHSHIFKRTPYQVIDHQGNSKWVQDVCRPIRDEFDNVSHYYSHISDISALKVAEHKLTLSHDYIQKVVDTLPDPTLVINVSDYQLQLTNQAARALYNDSRDIHQKITCYRLSHKRDTPCTGLTDPCPIQEVLITGKPASVRHKHFDHNGNLLYVDVRATPLFDSTGQHIEQIVESHRDVTEMVDMEKQLHHLATTDRLTQTYNRLKFDDELKNQIEWARTTGNSIGLIMFDLDHFKQVNDNHGHDVGDEVLKNTVNLVQQHIRTSDTLARWGGEEFMIITPLTDPLELKSVTESLRSLIEKHEHTGVGRVTASFGGSVMRHEDNITTLLKRVDAALYQSKQNGRNRCTIIE